jgi:hypothetical protein
VNSQLKNIFIEKNILSGVLSGFRSGHSTTTAAMAVANDIINVIMAAGAVLSSLDEKVPIVNGQLLSLSC